MSVFSSSISQLLPISLWERTVFVKCIPSPATFTQRRAVLRALQKDTGQSIEVFRKLRSDSGSFYAVTAKPEAASALIDESPFERTLILDDTKIAEEVKMTEWGSMYTIPKTITSPVNPLPRIPATPTTDGSNELGLSHMIFKIHCFPPNPTFDHLQTVRSHPLHGPWPDGGGRETFISASLRRWVPSGPLAPALRDWVSGDQLSRESTHPGEEAGEGALSILLGRSRANIYNHERARARWKVKERPEVMKSLVAFAAKCRAAEAGPHEDQQSETPSSSSPSPPKPIPGSGRTTSTGKLNEPTKKTASAESYWGATTARQTEKPMDDNTFKEMMEGDSATKGRSNKYK